MNSPKPTDVIASIPATTPFVGPETLERQLGRIFELRLGANESLFGPSPKAIDAMQAASAMGHLYGDPEAYLLRSEIALQTSAKMENVVLGGGIDELLMLFARAYVAPGQPVVTTLGSYPTFEYAVTSVGGEFIRVPYAPDGIVDLPRLAETVREVKPKIVYLANPDNPSSTWHSLESVKQFQEAIPPDTLFLLDEAYWDFAPGSSAFDPENPSVVRLRTFSKAHGMAGMRIGYALCHADHVATLNKFRMHFGVSIVAQAGALAALRDPEYVESVVAETKGARRWFAEQLSASGFDALPSATNFLTIDLESEPRASQTLLSLREKGVFIRKPMVAPLDRFIRVTVGKQEHMERFLEVFRSAL